VQYIDQSLKEWISEKGHEFGTMRRATAFIQAGRYHSRLPIGQIRAIYEGSDYQRLRRYAEKGLPANVKKLQLEDACGVATKAIDEISRWPS
jgi:hypothetical protein